MTMYTKILIVSLVQAAVARHVHDVRLRTQYNTESEFRNPGIEHFNVHKRDTQFTNPDDYDYTYSTGDYSGHHEPYIDNNDESFRHNSQPANNYEIEKHERLETKINDQNNNRRDHHTESFGSRDSDNYDNAPGNNFDYEKQDRLRTNLDSQYNGKSDSSFHRRIEYNTPDTDSYYDQRTEDKVRTNGESNFNSETHTYFNRPIETNPNIKFIDTKATPLQEVQSNDGGAEEKWVWDTYTTVEPTRTLSNKTEPGLPGGDVDDRTIFEADRCPKGHAKVSGTCIQTIDPCNRTSKASSPHIGCRGPV